MRDDHTQHDPAGEPGAKPPSGGLSGIFIRKPIATIMLMIGLLLLGAAAYFTLPVAPLPNISVATLSVTSQLPGADARINASSLTTPLERQFGQIPGLTQMTSSSALGFSQIALQFGPSVSLQQAEVQAQAAIAAAGGALPTTLPTPPTFRAVNPADTPVLILGLTSDTLPLTTVDDYAESVMFQQLSQQPGVGLVTIGGQQQPAMRVELDPAKLANVGLTLEEVRTAISSATLEAAKGTIRGPRQTWGISADDQLSAASQYDDTIIAWKNGAPIRVKDVGYAKVGPANSELEGWYNHKRAIILNVLPSPGANVIDTVDHIKKILPRLKASLPPAVKVAVVSDRTLTIRESVEDVEMTLVLTVFLVVAVIFLFLREGRATLIPALAVPLSIIGTFAVMKASGFSLDNLSLMALSIGVGFVVDDAIVMIENIVRHLEEGLPPLQAALKGAGEIGFTILSITVSLVAVFIPLLLMGGLVGRMFQEFAITLAVAIAMSAFVSLTLTPTLCSKLLKHQEGAKSRLYEVLERGFVAVTNVYDRGLRVVLRHQGVTLFVMLGTIVLTGVLYVTIPKGFFPQEDTGLLSGVTQAGQDISTDGMAQRQEQINNLILQDPAVESVASYIGPGPSSPAPNQGRLFVALKPLGRRGPHGSAPQVISRIQRRAAAITGIKLYLQAAQDITIGARASKSAYQYTLVDVDPAELSVWASKVRAALAKAPGVTGVASDAVAAAPELSLKINRDQASRLGITASQIDDALYDAFGERPATKVYTPYNVYFVIMEVAAPFRMTPDALNQVFLRSANGSSVPLSTVATLTSDTAPLLVNHDGGFPSVTLSFNLKPGASIGQAVSAVQNIQRELHLPKTVQTKFSGAAQAFQSALSGMDVLILAALIAVYLVLGMLYESWVHPLTILSTLPSAGLGALLTLMAVGMPLDVIGIIGIVLLIGIVKKNGIMMVDFALQAERSGKSPEEAVHEACLARFRPILMTTVCAMLGGVPLMLAQGAGAELRQPLGFAIVGGLAVSQALTLFTTPVVYLFMDRLGARLGRLFPRGRARRVRAYA
ncbi:MAG TPA: efflux RND transporter permease subunit [Caulobacteraceae bacterium]|nr:efflux RND transporter permease subunit [Caulobacteraceae bacterium]